MKAFEGRCVAKQNVCDIFLFELFCLFNANTLNSIVHNLSTLSSVSILYTVSLCNIIYIKQGVYKVIKAVKNISNNIGFISSCYKDKH